MMNFFRGLLSVDLELDIQFTKKVMGKLGEMRDTIEITSPIAAYWVP
jgi:hypothetical protein